VGTVMRRQFRFLRPVNDMKAYCRSKFGHITPPAHSLFVYSELHPIDASMSASLFLASPRAASISSVNRSRLMAFKPNRLVEPLGSLVSYDADGAVHPDKDECCRHRNADGGSVRDIARLPRYQLIRTFIIHTSSFTILPAHTTSAQSTTLVTSQARYGIPNGETLIAVGTKDDGSSVPTRT